MSLSPRRLDRVNLRLPRLRDVDRLFRRRRLERRLERFLPPGSGLVQIVLADMSSHGGNQYRFLVRKEGRSLVLGADWKPILRDEAFFRIYSLRAGVHLELLARSASTVTEALVEISDGSASADGLVSFCSFHPKAILVPDSDFHASGGYSSFRNSAEGPIPWEERDSTLVWRGSSTGKGEITTESMDGADARLIQRTRACLLGRGIAGADIKLVNLVQSPDPPTDRARLEAAGILGDPIDGFSWRGRKYALDVDGNSNSWSGLFTRLLLGCCVLKVASARGFRQWYYHALRPFEHYVPVAADLSDFAEQIEWCRSHQRECAAIAAAGREFARERTLEREMAEAVDRLEYGGNQ